MFAEGDIQKAWTFYTEFKPYTNIEKTIGDIQKQVRIKDDQVGRNVKLLTMMFQSRDSYMSRLYATAAVLAVLVTCAGVLMITGSPNSNISQRTQFFGMLRRLGATKKQTIRL